mmetsp:Transcript_16531/g.44760  ORF Transcript_16531/g.44760 Transcript_16531/m.44760 type:complete len:253 (-) Transcript_16531:52-810(-)
MSRKVHGSQLCVCCPCEALRRCRAARGDGLVCSQRCDVAIYVVLEGFAACGLPQRCIETILGCRAEQLSPKLVMTRGKKALSRCCGPFLAREDDGSPPGLRGRTGHLFLQQDVYDDAWRCEAPFWHLHCIGDLDFEERVEEAARFCVHGHNGDKTPLLSRRGSFDKVCTTEAVTPERTTCRVAWGRFVSSGCVRGQSPQEPRRLLLATGSAEPDDAETLFHTFVGHVGTWLPVVFFFFKCLTPLPPTTYSCI